MRRFPHWLLSLVLLGCSVSAQPSPPSIQLDDVTTADPGEVLAGEDARGVVDGAAGSVEPPEGVVVITPLDSDEAPLVEPVRNDGSFRVEFAPAGELRLQVRNGDVRSEPVDVIVDGGHFLRAPRPLAACFTMEPALDVDLPPVRAGRDDEVRVRLRNECQEALTLTTRLRGDGPFALLSAPEQIAPGERADIRLRVAPDAPGYFEDVLIVDVAVPQDRRALTLFLRAR